jgi:hypothetical protein
LSTPHDGDLGKVGEVSGHGVSSSLLPPVTALTFSRSCSITPVRTAETSLCCLAVVDIDNELATAAAQDIRFDCRGRP